MKKAFEVINVNIALRKLNHYGFRESSNRFFRNLFMNRSQYVKVNDVDSDCRDVTIGLTQGSVLSPSLVNLFINDLCAFSELYDFKCTLYADDAAFCCTGGNFDDIINRLNVFITALTNWLVGNKLIPNTDKDQTYAFLILTSGILPYSTIL